MGRLIRRRTSFVLVTQCFLFGPSAAALSPFVATPVLGRTRKLRSLSFIVVYRRVSVDGGHPTEHIVRVRRIIRRPTLSVVKAVRQLLCAGGVAVRRHHHTTARHGHGGSIGEVSCAALISPERRNQGGTLVDPYQRTSTKLDKSLRLLRRRDREAERRAHA